MYGSLSRAEAMVMMFAETVPNHDWCWNVAYSCDSWFTVSSILGNQRQLQGYKTKAAVTPCAKQFFTFTLSQQNAIQYIAPINNPVAWTTCTCSNFAASNTDWCTGPGHIANGTGLTSLLDTAFLVVTCPVCKACTAYTVLVCEHECDTPFLPLSGYNLQCALRP